jgi:hypothetical protein
MGQSMMDKIKKIRSTLEDKADQEPPYDNLREKEIKNAIHDAAGMDPRTVKKYMDALKQKEIIFRPEVMSEIEEDDETLYKIEKRDPIEQNQEKIDLSGDSISVNVKTPRKLKQKADSMGINHSEIFTQALLQEVNDLESIIDTVINRKYSSEEIDVTDKEFIHKIINKNCYLDGKRDEIREEIYSNHYGQLNSYHCSEMRRKAAHVAEDLGLIKKPPSLQ